MFSADIRSTDTELSELKHKELKKDFKSCNQQYGRYISNTDFKLLNKSNELKRAMSILTTK